MSPSSSTIRSEGMVKSDVNSIYICIRDRSSNRAAVTDFCIYRFLRLSRAKITRNEFYVCVPVRNNRKIAEII